MADKTRWGILSTGRIAGTFAEGLAFASNAELMAVGSRSQEKADAFGERFGVARCHGSYEALVADPEVDAVYVATPHPFHMGCTLLCLEHGKAVLCEKPFAMNAGQARKMAETARKNRVFLMEAMWTRFVPLIVRMRELIADGAIGEVRVVKADFGFRAGLNPESRLFDPELGGGALLDVGCYAVSFAQMVLGAPAEVTGLAHIGETGVDEQAAMVLGYEGGQLALLGTAVRTSLVNRAEVVGTEGYIDVEPPFYKATRLTLARSGKEPEVIEMPIEGNGYQFEAEEVGRCIAAGRAESPALSLEESVSVMETMDRARAQWGLKYPME